ncbi:MAG: hypothetical protein ACJ761_04895 [Chloroflexota bacterium]
MDQGNIQYQMAKQHIEELQKEAALERRARELRRPATYRLPRIRLDVRQLRWPRLRAAGA